MVFENNWKSKSLDSLEKINSEVVKNSSYLLMTCSRLRKKPIKDFSVEDLRIMIGQNIGLPFLIPLAIEQLEENILVEGDFYEGDLLKVVLDSKEKYWKKEKQNWNKVCRIFEENESYINEFCLNNGYKNKWIIQYQSFVKFN